jgi:hypothetical protein
LIVLVAYADSTAARIKLLFAATAYGNLYRLILLIV